MCPEFTHTSSNFALLSSTAVRCCVQRDYIASSYFPLPILAIPFMHSLTEVVTPARHSLNMVVVPAKQSFKVLFCVSFC